ncbi:hypothetical protein M758_UG005000 [Ceratodon purpureus]|nr:hypothetical protein M758_UG005000 [Ceratodon purpureus]
MICILVGELLVLGMLGIKRGVSMSLLALAEANDTAASLCCGRIRSSTSFFRLVSGSWAERLLLGYLPYRPGDHFIVSSASASEQHGVSSIFCTCWEVITC